MRRLALLGALLVCRPVAAEPPPPPIVESVRIEGATITRLAALYAKAGYAEDTELDEALVEEARLRLLETGLFQRVDARLERGRRRGRVVLVFEVEERPTLSLDTVHLGHARPTRIWGGLELSDLDPFGVGLALGAGFVTSGDQHAGELRFGLDDAFGWDRLDLGLTLRTLFGREPFVGPAGQRLDGEPVEDVRVPYQRHGGDLVAGLEVATFTRVSAGLRLEYATADPPAGAEQLDPDGAARPFAFNAPAGGLITALAAGIEYDTRDDPAFPLRGLRASFLLRVAQLDGDVWTSGLAGFEHYTALPWGGHVLRLDAKLGGLLGDAPFFERFFIGDLHPYIPARALGLNFARRRGPNLIDGTIVEQRYETLAGRLGFEYRIPVGPGPRREPYGVELFIGAAFLSLGSPGELGAADFRDRDPFPFDLAVDVGLRIESEIGVMGLSVGNLFLLIDPSP